MNRPKPHTSNRPPSNGPSICKRRNMLEKSDKGAAPGANKRWVSLRRIVTVSEVGIHYGLRDRGRNSATAFAVFDDQSDSNAWVVEGRE